MGELVYLKGAPPRHELSPDEYALESDIYRSFVASRTSIGYGKSEFAEVQRFRSFVGEPIWRWTGEDLDLYRGILQKLYEAGTRRKKEGAVRRMTAHAANPGHGFNERCRQLTGYQIQPLSLPGGHSGAETTKRRNLTSKELMRFFSCIWEYALCASRRTDYLARLIHYAMFHFVRAFGVRANETAMADEADLNPVVTPELASFSVFEDFHVRFGKSSNGGQPKRRSVPSIYLFRGSIDVVAWFVEEIRPKTVRLDSPDALFLTPWGERYRTNTLSDIFHKYRVMAGLSEDLTLHCLRHTFITNLREAGLQVRDITHLAGHEKETTSLIYDHMSDDQVKVNLLDFQRRISTITSGSQRVHASQIAPR
jgi:integrase/recombinase XerC